MGASTVLLAGCGAEGPTPDSRQVAPDDAPAIAPSLSALVGTWNDEVGGDRRAWGVEEVPAVDDTLTFDIDVAPDMWLSGFLNPSTERPVQVALFIVGAAASGDDPGEASPEGASGHGDDGAGAGHSHAEGDDGGHGEGPAGQDDLGHHDTAGAGAVEFEPAASHDAAVAVVRAASDADEGEAERIAADLGLGPDAVDTAAAAGDEPVEVVAHGRTFRFQVLRNVIVLSVRSEESWEFDDTGG